MPFKYRFFFLLAFLAVFTKVQYFNDQHKLKGGFTLLENKLVLGSARGEPAKTPSLRIGLTMACSCRYFRWVELRRIIKISGFPNCLWWRTCSSSCFRPSPVLAACSLKYHKLFQKISSSQQTSLYTEPKRGDTSWTCPPDLPAQRGERPRSVLWPTRCLHPTQRVQRALFSRA